MYVEFYNRYAWYKGINTLRFLQNDFDYARVGNIPRNKAYLIVLYAKNTDTNKYTRIRLLNTKICLFFKWRIFIIGFFNFCCVF